MKTKSYMNFFSNINCEWHKSNNSFCEQLYEEMTSFTVRTKTYFILFILYKALIWKQFFEPLCFCLKVFSAVIYAKTLFIVEGTDKSTQ